MMDKFRYLKVALAAVLGIVGAKMLLAQQLKEWLGARANLYLMIVVLLVLVIGVAASWVAAPRRTISQDDAEE
jgi:predicted tellurium resistance membrane protein TerC